MKQEFTTKKEKFYQQIIKDSKGVLKATYTRKIKTYLTKDVADKEFVVKEFIDDIVKADRNDFYRFNANGRIKRDRFLEELPGRYAIAKKMSKKYPLQYLIENELPDLVERRWNLKENQGIYSQYDDSILDKPETVLALLAKSQAFEDLLEVHCKKIDSIDPLNDVECEEIPIWTKQYIRAELEGTGEAYKDEFERMKDWERIQIRDHKKESLIKIYEILYENQFIDSSEFIFTQVMEGESKSRINWKRTNCHWLHLWKN